MSIHNAVAGGVFAMALVFVGAPAHSGSGDPSYKTIDPAHSGSGDPSYKTIDPAHSGSGDPSHKATDPLFAADSPLAITLSAPLSQAKEERDKAAVYAGEVRSEGRTFPVELTLRGNRRLSKKTCAYPPLRLEFDKTAVTETIFEHQSDLKLVVRCRDSTSYADYLRAEYLIYKALNVLTPMSFEARWVDVTFVDTNGKMTDRAEGAFFVERKNRLAKRNGREVADMPGIKISELDFPAAALLDLFQFVVANPDYSFTAAPPGDECCHNAKLLTGPTPGSYTPLIYDFDSAGAINAKYAAPAANLGIKKVTDRYYMGYCEGNDAAKGARTRLLASQAQVLELVKTDPLLGSNMKSRLIKFMTKGFDILRDDGLFTKQIIDRCR